MSDSDFKHVVDVDFEPFRPPLVGCEELDRESIRERFPWAFERGHKMVCGTDLDALLTATYLHHALGWELIGFYDLSTVYVESEHREDLLDAIWVDLDVSHPEIRSIGHHMLSFQAGDDLPCHSVNTLNPNLERGLYSNGRYTEKCPLPTIAFLHWLNEPDIELTINQAMLCWLADSGWVSGQSHKYRENVKQWVTHVTPVEYLVETWKYIDNPLCDRQMDGLISFLTRGTEFNEENASYTSRHLDVGGGQCSFTPDSLSTLISVNIVMGRLGRFMGWTPPCVPTDLEHIEGTRVHSCSYRYQIAQTHGSLDAWLVDTEPFSYAIPFSDNLNYTLLNLN